MGERRSDGYHGYNDSVWRWLQLRIGHCKYFVRSIHMSFSILENGSRLPRLKPPVVTRLKLSTAIVVEPPSTLPRRAPLISEIFECGQPKAWTRTQTPKISLNATRSIGLRADPPCGSAAAGIVFVLVSLERWFAATVHIVVGNVLSADENIAFVTVARMAT